MLLTLIILNILFSFGNLVVLIFLSIFLVRLRESSVQQQKDSKKNDVSAEINELDSVTRRLARESNFDNFYTPPYDMPTFLQKK
jgi:hypothetical protein